jgi:hypothetical protein
LEKLCLFLSLLCLWPNTSQAAQNSGCRNQIEILGGSTAILRGKTIDTVEELREVMAKTKYQEAFRQILIKAGLGSRYDEVMKKIGELKKIDEFPEDTQFEWMAFRHKSDKTIGLLWNSCWEKNEPLKAWRFTLEIDGQNRIFAIPATCLNLALLKDRPPTCTLEAQVECSYPEKPSQIKVVATAQASGKSTIEDIRIEGVPEGVTDQDKAKERYETSFPVTESKTYSFKAWAIDDKKLESVACTDTVTVCEKPKPILPCASPSCSLKVHNEWQKDKKSGKLVITVEEATGEGTVVSVTSPHFEKSFSNPLQDEPIEVPDLERGEYTVRLVTKAKKPETIYPGAPECKDATCSTTVNLEPPPQEEPRPCCVSPWLFRAFGGWVEPQGSDVNDWIMTVDGEKGDFKFDFNQGLGFGMEIERLWPWKEPLEARKLSDSRWGWTLGLFRADLDTRWVFDSPQHWIMDDDRVPMLALTTGLNFHWWHQSWDFFTGPVVGFVSLEDGSYADGTAKPGTFEANFDDSFAFGARAGFDAFIGKCWGLTGGVEYLKISTEANFSGRTRDVDVDPLILKAGFVYHF